MTQAARFCSLWMRPAALAQFLLVHLFVDSECPLCFLINNQFTAKITLVVSLY